ncbi:uncharacterized protein LOC130896866 [Diorhabda carinulata]|uniref:uncharacterized protein LOC130896866 n=1 Tax=Diorhabda carinulata TaxID=1163345 RepID=UPI0025A01767|nr:uncharacterized protein LOC130896866 [Diorhabda carinulata]
MASCESVTVPTCLLNLDTRENIRPVISWYISQHKCAILPYIDNINIYEKFKIQRVIIFVANYPQIYDESVKIAESVLYKVDMEISFVICERVINKKFLNRLLPHIWSKHISKFIVVFVHNKLQVYTYNPFKDNSIVRIKHFGERCQKLFEDKTKNMYGYPIRVLFFKRPPYAYLNKYNVWAGEDVAILNLISKQQNSTTTILNTDGTLTESDVGKYLYYNKIDLFMVRVFECFYWENSSSSYPYGIEDEVVLVPKPKGRPLYQQFFKIFSKEVIIIDILLMLIVSLLTYARQTRQNRMDIVKYILNGSLILVNAPIPGFNKINDKIKYLIILWIFGVVVINTQFNCSLTSMLVMNRTEGTIKTLEELRESNFKISINDYFLKNGYVPDSLGLKDKLLPVIQTEIEIFDSSRYDDLAFVIRRDIAEYFINNYKFNKGDTRYDILKESLIPGYNVYVFQKNSPYISKFNKYLLRLKQFGFNFKDKKFKIKVTPDKTRILTFSHLIGVLMIYTFGMCVASLVFLGELLWKKYNK